MKTDKSRPGSMKEAAEDAVKQTKSAAVSSSTNNNKNGDLSDVTPSTPVNSPQVVKKTSPKSKVSKGSFEDQVFVNKLAEGIAARMSQLGFMAVPKSSKDLSSNPLPKSTTTTNKSPSSKSHGTNKNSSRPRSVSFENNNKLEYMNVQLVATAIRPNVQNDAKKQRFTATIHFNTNDRLVFREMMTLTPNVEREKKQNQVTHRKRAVISRGRKLGGTLSSKNLDALQEHVNGKIDRYRIRLAKFGYDDMIIEDITTMAQLRDGASVIAFEKMYRFRRQKTGSDVEAEEQEIQAEDDNEQEEEESFDDDDEIEAANKRDETTTDEEQSGGDRKSISGHRIHFLSDQDDEDEMDEAAR